ncbi:hypothetical protein JOM56_013677 [Amanita muscaria]
MKIVAPRKTHTHVVTCRHSNLREDTVHVVVVTRLHSRNLLSFFIAQNSLGLRDEEALIGDITAAGSSVDWQGSNARLEAVLMFARSVYLMFLAVLKRDAMVPDVLVSPYLSSSPLHCLALSVLGNLKFQDNVFKNRPLCHRLRLNSNDPRPASSNLLSNTHTPFKHDYAHIPTYCPISPGFMHDYMHIYDDTTLAPCIVPKECNGTRRAEELIKIWSLLGQSEQTAFLSCGTTFKAVVTALKAMYLALISGGAAQKSTVDSTGFASSNHSLSFDMYSLEQMVKLVEVTEELTCQNRHNGITMEFKMAFKMDTLNNPIAFVY